MIAENRVRTSSGKLTYFSFHNTPSPLRNTRQYVKWGVLEIYNALYRGDMKKERLRFVVCSRLLSPDASLDFSWNIRRIWVSYSEGKSWIWTKVSEHQFSLLCQLHKASASLFAVRRNHRGFFLLAIATLKTIKHGSNANRTHRNEPHCNLGTRKRFYETCASQECHSQVTHTLQYR